MHDASIVRGLGRAIVLVLALLAPGCKSDGEKRLDELVEPLDEAARILEAPAPEGKTREQAAIEFLESRAVEARQAESRLDDVVKTLNPDRKKALSDYAERRIENGAGGVDKD